MKFGCYSLVLVLLAGCTTSRRISEPGPALPPVATRSLPSIDSFRFIGTKTTMDQVIAKLGPPDTSSAGGICCDYYSYYLRDGSVVTIASTLDGDLVSHIVFVKHGNDTIYGK